MKAKDIMTNNLIVSNNNSNVFEIAKIMKEKDIGFIPINNKNKIIGIITDRDIVVKILANNDTKIEDYISKNIITCNVNDSIDKILLKMKKNKIKRIIVEDKKKVVGVISLSDILNTNYNDIDKIMSIQSIWSISSNANTRDLEVDDFYL